VQRGERLLRHAGSDAARVEETPVFVMLGEEERAEIGSRPFGVGPQPHPIWVAPTSAARFTRSERRASLRSI
jgi:hypothetical protein